MTSALSISPEPCAAAAPTLARAERRAAFRDTLDKAADVVALGVMVAGWTALYCVLCPPARAAGDALITDVGWAWFATGAPIAMAVLLGLAVFWRDRGRPLVTDKAAEPGDIAQPTAPISLERYRRDADRG